MAETVTDVTDRKLYLRFPHRVPPVEEVKELSPYIVRVSYPRQKSARFCHVILESNSVIPEVRKVLSKKEYQNGHLIVEMPRKVKYVKNGQDSPVPEKKKKFKEKKTDFTSKENNKLSACDGNSTISPRGGGGDNSTPFTAGKHVRKRKLKPAVGGNNDRRLWIKKLPFRTEDKELLATFPGCIWAKVFGSKASKSSRAICKFTTAQQAAAIVADPRKHKFKGKDVVVEFAKCQQLRGSGMNKKYGLKNENSVIDIEGEHLKAEVESEAAEELKKSESLDENSSDNEEDNEEMSERGSDNSVSDKFDLSVDSSSDNESGGDNNDLSVHSSNEDDD